MKLFIGGDHSSLEMKSFLIKELNKQGYELEDVGTHSEKSVDYPDFAKKVANKVVGDKNSLGIIICGTGIGISIAANKIPGARAALLNETITTKLSREHNNANIIALGARIIAKEKALQLVEVFINTKFSEEERHVKRIEKLNNLIN
ncbi:ribose 5-phosphate isomerase B [Spiroplasma endosymbiont of Amphibalanus improvisus]|uniref:ribose 5-phosphate isomerase B n=1 Tax=Spiroplasma endosymbiont of Amphibalanus improvisus TaxID=3066327 RepID=UPI00313E3CBF